MSVTFIPPNGDISLSRRRFVQGLAAGGALLGMGMSPHASHADRLRTRMGPPVLSGSRFDLTYTPTPVNFTGKDRFATAINDSVPAPVLRWKEGDTVTLNVTNHLAEVSDRPFGIDRMEERSSVLTTDSVPLPG